MADCIFLLCVQERNQQMQQRFLYPGQGPAASGGMGEDGLGPLGDGWGELLDTRETEC